MPGPYIHIAVADALRTHWARTKTWPQSGGLPNMAGPAPGDLAQLAADHANYYALGAIGPDMFFFLPDFRAVCVFGHRFAIADPLIGMVQGVEKLYKLLDDWVLEDWERYIGPIGEDTSEAISRLTGDLSSVVDQVMSDLAAIGFTAVLDLVTQSKDWFELFSLGLNKGYDDQDFFWSDMLHYRKTSHFVQTMWQMAEEEENAAPTTEESAEAHKARADRFRAYALGFASHLGTDTTGHPFVNEKVGGPYRLHWQRHHLVENHMDAQVYDDQHGSDLTYNQLTESALHYRIAFKEDDPAAGPPTPPPYDPSDNSLRALYVRRRHLDLDSELPDDLAAFLFDAFARAYNTAATPDIYAGAESSPRILPGNDGRPDAAAIASAYDLLFRYLKNAMLDGFHHEKPKPPEVFPNLDFPQLTDPHDDPPNAGDEDMSFWDWALAVLRFLLWMAEVAVWLATVLPAIIADLGTYPFRVIAYYSIELPLYYILRAERMVLVMTGFMLPMKDEIDLGLVRLCTGHRDSFLALLQDMDDALAGIEDAALAVLEGEFQALAGGVMSPDDIVKKLLGDLTLKESSPSEPNPDRQYPRRHENDAAGNSIEYHHPWDYPVTPTEPKSTSAGPYTCGAMPSVLVADAMAGTQSVRNAYERAQTPADSDLISLSRMNARDHLGDPVNFSAYLTWQLTRKDFPAHTDNTRLVDWNLDADRGYAYRCWDWDRHIERPRADPHDVAHHVLTDQEGHEYLEPCTPPPQAERPGATGCGPAPLVGYNPERDLRLHFADQPDPGCK